MALLLLLVYLPNNLPKMFFNMLLSRGNSNQGNKQSGLISERNLNCKFTSLIFSIAGDLNLSTVRDHQGLGNRQAKS